MATEAKTEFESLRGHMAEIMRVNAEQITPETQFGDFPQWDSMGHMDLMVMLESEFGVPINADTISELVSIQAILDQIRAQNDG
jgi:acyl carrier protein